VEDDEIPSPVPVRFVEERIKVQGSHPSVHRKFDKPSPCHAGQQRCWKSRGDNEARGRLGSTERLE